MDMHNPHPSDLTDEQWGLVEPVITAWKARHPNRTCPAPPEHGRMAQEQLTAKGEHRSAGPVDLLVAAAEEAGLTLLHHDRDFETIARTTGQPVRTIDVRR